MLKRGTKGVSKSNCSLRRMQLERGTSECKTRCVSECRVEGVSDVLAGDFGMEEHQGTSPEWPNMTTHRSWGEKEVSETYTALEGGSNIWRVLCGWC